MAIERKDIIQNSSFASTSFLFFSIFCFELWRRLSADTATAAHWNTQGKGTLLRIAYANESYCCLHGYLLLLGTVTIFPLEFKRSRGGLMGGRKKIEMHCPGRSTGKERESELDRFFFSFSSFSSLYILTILFTCTGPATFSGLAYLSHILFHFKYEWWPSGWK
jgi:hypothetical protein